MQHLLHVKFYLSLSEHLVLEQVEVPTGTTNTGMTQGCTLEHILKEEKRKNIFDFFYLQNNFKVIHLELQ